MKVCELTTNKQFITAKIDISDHGLTAVSQIMISEPPRRCEPGEADVKLSIELCQERQRIRGE